ncbi:MAG: hypothetical protein E6G28_07130 [Actinobacteria bacterium]|nr:MAG: hypothetical protein E6G28_07130 [Actinomycetota bacterium]
MAPGDMQNAEIADNLGRFAALLELADTNPYAVRAYLRAAELIRSTPASVTELVRTGRIRELRGIGPGIETKLRELVATGGIAELESLEREIHPELVGFGRLLGLTAKRMLAIALALDVGTVAEFRKAVEDGRLAGVAGVGPVTEARIRAALAREPAAPRGLTLSRSRPLVGAIAAALDGEIAGAPRRFCELSHELVVVCAADEPAPVLARFATLPTVVSVLERSERRALGVTVEGVPVTLVVATSSTFGTELFRATGSVEYVRAREPLPDAPDEEALFAELGLPYCPPELRESASAMPPPGLLDGSDIRGDLHCHTTWSDGRATVREMALSASARGRPHAERRGRARARFRRARTPGRGDRKCQRGAAAVQDPAGRRVRHSRRRGARRGGPRATRARLGPAQPARRTTAPAVDTHADGHRGDATSGGARAEPSEGSDPQPSPRERSRSGGGVRRREGDRCGSRGERAARPARSLGDSRPRSARRGRRPSRELGRALRCGPREHRARDRHSAQGRRDDLLGGQLPTRR